MDHAITLRGLMIAAGVVGIPLSIAGTVLVGLAYASIGLIVAGKWL